MQPVALSADVDTRLIDMHEIRLSKLGLRPLPEGIQSRIGFFVEVEHRSRTDRNLHLILEVVPDSIIGNQLVLGHIDRIGLQVGAILNRSVHSFRERGHESIPLIVFKDLCLVFGHESCDVDIDDLAMFMAYLLILLLFLPLDCKSPS